MQYAANRRYGHVSLLHRTYCRCTAHVAKAHPDDWTVLPLPYSPTERLLGHSLRRERLGLCPVLRITIGAWRSRLHRWPRREKFLGSLFRIWCRGLLGMTNFYPCWCRVFQTPIPRGIVLEYLETLFQLCRPIRVCNLIIEEDAKTHRHHICFSRSAAWYRPSQATLTNKWRHVHMPFKPNLKGTTPGFLWLLEAPEVRW